MCMRAGMCQAIQDFDVEHKESVNMRVGVHTGDILCGIVGSRRFKFDVFSNDVTLANMMESSGFPGRVHISEPTRGFLKDQYELEDGPDVQGISTLLHTTLVGARSPLCFTSLYSAFSPHSRTRCETSSYLLRSDF